MEDKNSTKIHLAAKLAWFLPRNDMLEQLEAPMNVTINDHISDLTSQMKHIDDSISQHLVTVKVLRQNKKKMKKMLADLEWLRCKS